MSNEQLEFAIGEDENPATVEMNEDGSEAVLADAPQPPEVEIEGAPAQAEQKQHSKELDDYSTGVRKRIEKLTARLRDRKSTRLNSSHSQQSRMPSSA